MADKQSPQPKGPEPGAGLGKSALSATGGGQTAQAPPFQMKASDAAGFNPDMGAAQRKPEEDEESL